MERADVVVIGGGPAGSSLAAGLRGSGLRVVILDRARFPRDKMCAGWVTPPVFECLGIEPEEYGQGRVLQPIHGFRVGVLGGRQSATSSEDVVSYGIRRCEFDTALLERSGAEVREGEPLRSLERTPLGLRVNGAIEASLVVGAGGHFCPIARRLMLGPKSEEPLIAAQEVEFRLDPAQARACPVAPETPHIAFLRDLKGYGWVFRKGDYLNVGLGRQDRANLSGHLADFLAELRREGRLPPDLPDGFRGHAYLLYDQAPRRLFDEGLALVGDAAGLAYPRSGEGIRPAVESGLLLARVLRDAPGDKLGAPEMLAAYERALLDRLGSREHRPGVTDRLPGPLVRFLAAHLLGHPRVARDVVVRRWFLHAGVPALGGGGEVPALAETPSGH